MPPSSALCHSHSCQQKTSHPQGLVTFFSLLEKPGLFLALPVNLETPLSFNKQSISKFALFDFSSPGPHNSAYSSLGDHHPLNPQSSQPRITINNLLNMVFSRSILLSIGAALFGVSSVLAAQTTCSLDNKCPEDAPCCSREFFLHRCLLLSAVFPVPHPTLVLFHCI